MKEKTIENIFCLIIKLNYSLSNSNRSNQLLTIKLEENINDVGLVKKSSTPSGLGLVLLAPCCAIPALLFKFKPFGLGSGCLIVTYHASQTRANNGSGSVFQEVPNHNLMTTL